MSHGSRRMRRKAIKKEDPRRLILLGMTMTNPMVRRRRSTFYPRTMKAMRTSLKKIKQKAKV